MANLRLDLKPFADNVSIMGRVVTLMIAYGLSIYDLSVKTGIAEGSIARSIKSGKISKLQNIEKIAAALNTTVAYLQTGTQSENIPKELVPLRSSEIKIFERLAIEKRWIAVNPARKVKKKPVTERVPEYSLEEAKAVLAELSEIPDERYYQAFFIALNTGLRRGEVANLNWNQIDLQNWEIHVQNKINKKPEFVGFNQAVYDILINRQKIQSMDGNIWNGLSENYLYEVVKKQIRKLGLNPKLRFHSARHTFVTEAVNGFGIHIAADMARHYDISMTAKYYHGKKEIIKSKAREFQVK